MTKITRSMRLKVKRDTFFLPEPNRGVYFRNNLCSFRLEGSSIDRWVEKLLPMFNGEYTLEDLTNGLSAPYRKRVYEIAEVLYRNGFVKDVSQDRPHKLPDRILKKYASQIEFIDSFGGSGASRFEAFRQIKALAIGSGPILVSLVSALIESGLPKVHLLITDSEATNRQRLAELEEYFYKTDPDVLVMEVALQKEGKSSWREIVQPFDSILYVSQEGNVEELQVLQTVSRDEKKLFLPAICLQQVGMAGPLVHPESEGCWESAWRRIHKSAFDNNQSLHPFSVTGGAMLANVIVFELFKKVTGITQSEQMNPFYLLDLDTLEGKWHTFQPHPLVTGRMSVEWVQDLDLQLDPSSSNSSSKSASNTSSNIAINSTSNSAINSTSSGDQGRLLPFFSQLTSVESGIFHIWEAGDLKQLPLAHCRVQVVDPMSAGPAELLPELICTGLTHEEARREAGLAGIEAYVSKMVGLLRGILPVHTEAEDRIVESQEDDIGIGTGETLAEGVFRGLQQCLAEELNKRQGDQKNAVSRVQLSRVEDERCRFYLQTLTTMKGEPVIGLGEEVHGFPVVWVGTDGRWYGSVGFNLTIALRRALQQVLAQAKNQTSIQSMQLLDASSVRLEETQPQNVVIHTCEEMTHSEILQSAIQNLKRNGKRIFVCEISLEPWLKEELAGVFGVMLREEATR